MSTLAASCPSCGARNAADAAWCSMCFEPLGAPTAPAPTPPAPPAPAAPAPDVAPEPPATGRLQPPPAPRPEALLPLPPPAGPPTEHHPAPPDLGPSPAGADGPRPVRELADGGFRDTPDGLEWRCRTCDTWNPIERVTCTVCRAPFGPAVGAAAPRPRPEVAPGLLAGISVVLPGAGHGMLGLWGQAITRGLLGMIWGLGGLSIVLRGMATSQPLAPGIPLLIGWLVMAVMSANDAMVEGGSSGRVLLQPRVLLWLTVGVVGLTASLALFSAMSALGG